MRVFASTLDTPIGAMLAMVNDEGALVALAFVDGSDATEIARRYAPGCTIAFEDGPARQVWSELAEYFAGERTEFTVKTAPVGTPFQKSVWRALAKIPYGETIGYGELARRVGNASASRAVGRANGANPISVVVPCHRVIGVRGELTGYGGGLERKRALLQLEGALPDGLGLSAAAG